MPRPSTSKPTETKPDKEEPSKPAEKPRITAKKGPAKLDWSKAKTKEINTSTPKQEQFAEVVKEGSSSSEPLQAVGLLCPFERSILTKNILSARKEEKIKHFPIKATTGGRINTISETRTCSNQSITNLKSSGKGACFVRRRRRRALQETEP